MPSNVKEFLDRQGIRYVTIRHSIAYTAQEVAAAAHLPGRAVAKTVIVKIDGQPAMAVLPANHKIDLNELREMTGANKIQIASEAEFREWFPNCEVGAMPPFGNLYGMEVFVSPTLADSEQIAFNAGSHSELIQMAFKDFENLVQPKVVHFTM